MTLEVRLCEAEGKDVNLDFCLTGAQRLFGEPIEAIHDDIGHGKAAGGQTSAMQQDVRAGARERPIERIREADIERTGVLARDD